jgi:hypothetical protein
MRSFYKPLILGITLISSHLAFANSANLSTCPSINSFKASRFEASAPYGYDARTKSMNILAVMEYPSYPKQTFDLLIYPIKLKTGDDLLTRTNALITQLQSESDTPLTFHINDEDGDMSVCAYTLPSDSSVTALLVADDSDINYNHDFSNSNEQRTQARQSFAKQMLNIK